MSEYVFDREKLNARVKEFEADPNSEENQKWLAQEYERCKDPRYFFNAYWLVDGKAPEPKSEEEWKEYEKWQNNKRNNWESIRLKRRTWI